MTKDLTSLLPEELEAIFQELGQPRYRAEQLFTWFARGEFSYAAMANLPGALREQLVQEFPSVPLRCLNKQVSAHDGTIKYLWELADGNAVETVVMRYRHGNTVCISSQVGCRQGCAFCASTIGGLVRNLTAGEILQEVLASERDSGLPLSNIVLMGIGEPLDNYDNVLRFFHLVSPPKGRNLGMRHISLSTCGLTEQFDRLASEGLQLTLSVSLHAPDDETRSRIMPANRGRGVGALMAACGDYAKRTGRRISFEYAMIRDVNDTDRHARLLAQRVRPVGGHVNLIPLNHVEERDFLSSTPQRIRRFVEILEHAGVNVTVRRKLGGDVDASCGQLRRKREQAAGARNS